MSLKTPGNDLLQKITLRKLYFTFKIQKKRKINEKKSFEKVGLNHEKFKISGKKVRDMSLKTPGNDLLQKITLRKV